MTSTASDGALAAALEADAAAHERGDFGDIGVAYDTVYGELLPIQDRSVRRFSIAFSFWDGWIDARNHDWRFYDGIARDDWPRLAREIAIALRDGVDPVDPAVTTHFAPENLVPLRTRLWARIRGR